MKTRSWAVVSVAAMLWAGCGSDSGGSSGSESSEDTAGEGDDTAPGEESGEGTETADAGEESDGAEGSTDAGESPEGGDAEEGDPDSGNEDAGGEGSEDTGGEESDAGEGADTGEGGGEGGGPVINEVVASALDGSADWCELYNPSDEEIDLSGWVFRDDRDDHSYVFPDGASIAAGGYLVLYSTGGPGAFVFDFGLGASDSARLFDASGALQQETVWEDNDALPGRSWGRYPNGTGDFDTLESPTLAATNAPPLDAPPPSWPPLVVNEVMASAADDGPDWVELFNPTAEDVDLEGWYITDKPGDAPNTWTKLPAGTEVPAGGRLVLYGAGAATPSFIFGLGAGDSFLLAAPDFSEVDDVDWNPGQAPTGWSYGNVSDGADERASLDEPTPGAPNIGPTQAGDEPQENTMAFVEFHCMPVAVDDAVGEFIELVNSSNGTIDIDGWVLAEGSGSWHRIDAGGSLLVGPGGRILLSRSAEFADQGAEPDYVYGDDIALSNTEDSLVLLAWGEVVDRVDYDETWPLVPGASVQLDSAIVKPVPNDFASNWCAGTTEFGDGDKGTPGEENLACE
jgi:hypothetical protein